MGGRPKQTFLQKRHFPSGISGKESAHQSRRPNRCGFDPWVGKIPWKRKWKPTPAFLPGESHGQRSLAGYSPRGHKKVRHNLATKPSPLQSHKNLLSPEHLSPASWPSPHWCPGPQGQWNSRHLLPAQRKASVHTSPEPWPKWALPVVDTTTPQGSSWHTTWVTALDPGQHRRWWPRSCHTSPPGAQCRRVHHPPAGLLCVLGADLRLKQTLT